MRIIYVEGDPERRAACAALAARDCPDVTLHVAADYNGAVAVYDQAEPPDLIISGVSYPGILESYNSGAIDLYVHNCDDQGIPKVPFVFFYNPAKDDKPGEISTILQMWAGGFCMDPAGLYLAPGHTIVDVITREKAQSSVPARYPARSATPPGKLLN